MVLANAPKFELGMPLAESHDISPRIKHFPAGLRMRRAIWLAARPFLYGTAPAVKTEI